MYEDIWEVEDNETGVTLTRYKGMSDILMIPNEIHGKPVTKLGYDFLSTYDGTNKKDRIVKVRFEGNTVTEIGEEAFCGCPSLEIINIPSSVINIGKRAFAFCGMLRHLDIPDTVETMGAEVFGRGEQLNDLHLPSKWTSLNPEWFIDKRVPPLEYDSATGYFRIGWHGIYTWDDVSNSKELCDDFRLTKEWFNVHFPRGASNLERVKELLDVTEGSADTRNDTYCEVLVTHYMFEALPGGEENLKVLKQFFLDSMNSEPAHPVFGRGWFGNMVKHAFSEHNDITPGTTTVMHNNHTWVLDGAITGVHSTPTSLSVTMWSFTEVDNEMIMLATMGLRGSIDYTREWLEPSLNISDSEDGTTEMELLYYCNLTDTADALSTREDALDVVNKSISALKELYTENYTDYELPEMYLPDCLTPQTTVEAGMEVLVSNIFPPRDSSKEIKIRLIMICDLVLEMCAEERAYGRAMRASPAEFDLGSLASIFMRFNIYDEQKMLELATAAFEEIPDDKKSDDHYQNTKVIGEYLIQKLSKERADIDVEEILALPCFERRREWGISCEEVLRICEKTWDAIPDCLKETGNKMELIKQFIPNYVR